MNALQGLTKLAIGCNRTGYPNVPASSRPRSTFSGKTASDLIQAIPVKRWISRNRSCASRINAQAQCNEQLGQGTEGNTPKGVVDGRGIEKGKHLSLTSKIGRNPQSSRQQLVTLNERSGRYAYVARSFGRFCDRANQSSGINPQTKGGESV